METPLRFIDLRRKSGQDEDKSSLSIGGNRNTPGFLSVVGGLPHSVEIAPYDEAARLALIAWLQSDECKALTQR